MAFKSLTIAAVAMSSLTATSVAAHENRAEHRLETIMSHFAEGTVVGASPIADCTLKDGTQTSCFAITVTWSPESHATGPWCPTNISQTGDDVGGIWLDNDQVYEVDGPLIKSWPNFITTKSFGLFNLKPERFA